MCVLVFTSNHRHGVLYVRKELCISLLSGTILGRITRADHSAVNVIDGNVTIGGELVRTVADRMESSVNGVKSARSMWSGRGE